MSPAPTARSIRIGSWIKLSVPVAMEAVFAAGADFACLDMCNGLLSLESVDTLLAHAAPGARLVRLASDANPALIGQLLDAGADGVVVPHVDSADRAREYVGAAFFPPVGCRGMGSTGRQGRWGLEGTADYLTRGQHHATGPQITIMVESADALAQVDELAEVSGIAQLLVGSADLALELGHDPQALERATRRVATACVQRGLSAAIAVGRPADVARYHAQGFDTFYLSNDATLLARAAQTAYREARTPFMAQELSA